MNITNNTVLITGGTAGIGFELAKSFTEAGNKVIITGRNPQRLAEALSRLPGSKGFNGDISNSGDTEKLVDFIKTNAPELNIVVNNAGAAHLYKLANNEDAFENAQDEMLTNYLAVIRLNEKLIPLLKSQPQAAVVNVSSIVAFVPGSLPTYSASKAALHSYTQSLRITLERTSNVKVFELMPPLVDTEFSAPINGKTGIPASQVASDLITAIQSDDYEVRVGNTQKIYELYLQSPAEALAAMNPAG
ncbi:MAG TPA: SDR family NAD(P)-dependent oxidoreductase [Pedobacter sp.]|uniref:SDR family oxidoreductase n=1 Tax=Pedobacter sp. TaxID=1411316 RepID=UPI002D1169DA|nr:SDR family NAD(P)-dependent oxidoreductase [Pedobacter sp.]HMI03290.1 SDR family NAD(P)-dependent oxidoreductase [Pedobacter sp.]